MSEVAAWVLSATHWYALLKQPMMVVIWSWEDASRSTGLARQTRLANHFFPKTTPQIQNISFSGQTEFLVLKQPCPFCWPFDEAFKWS